MRFNYWEWNCVLTCPTKDFLSNSSKINTRYFPYVMPPKILTRKEEATAMVFPLLDGSAQLEKISTS